MWGLDMRWIERVNYPANFIVVCGFFLMATSCALIEKRVDRMAGGPMIVADTDVYLDPDSNAQSKAVGKLTVSPGPLKITVTEAILLCLENNRALSVERLTPSIQETAQNQERAVFDPTASAVLTVGRIKGEQSAGSGPESKDGTTDSVESVISLEQYFPTGTTVGLGADLLMEDNFLYDDKWYTTRLGMTVNQALLKGFGVNTNLVRLRQARLDTRMSEYELRGFTETLVAEVETSYWDYALARRRIEIVEESLKLARQQLNETEELIAVGRLARSELAAVQAELAAQEQALIEAQAGEESIRLKMLRLLNPSGPDIWQREIDLIHQPTLPNIKTEDVAQHVAVSMRMSPILNEARLKIVRGDLELVKTRNGLLPLMDLFIGLGKSGYADSFGRAADAIANEDGYDVRAGVRFNLPVFNRDEKARHRRALLTKEQTWKVLQNLSQLVEVDVRTAYIEVIRTQKQIAASSVTRRFNEEKLRTETEKFRVGKSTSILVAQAQRDLLASRIAEVQALANHLKARIDIYRQDGSLLERRRISAPGREPVALSKN